MANHNHNSIVVPASRRNMAHLPQPLPGCVGLFFFLLLLCCAPSPSEAFAPLRHHRSPPPAAAAPSTQAAAAQYSQHGWHGQSSSPSRRSSRRLLFRRGGGDKEAETTAQPSSSSSSGMRRQSNDNSNNNPNVLETKGMPDLVAFLQQRRPSSSTAALVTVDDDDTNDAITAESSSSFATVFAVAALVGGALVLVAAHSLGLTVQDVTETAAAFLQHPQETLNTLVEDIRNEDAGLAAPFLYGLVYCVAEILAVPATPLTLSAGYLFGLTQGVAVVLAAGTVAACVGFFIGKTALRGAVEGLLAENPEWRKLDRAIGQQGFRLLVLVRLTPIFPFSLSNYIYGASAISFWPYFWGTLLGFTPGTIAYVYSGMVGQSLLSGEGQEPWYWYAAGGALLAGALKVITDTATGIVKDMEEDMEDE